MILYRRHRARIAKMLDISFKALGREKKARRKQLHERVV